MPSNMAATEALGSLPSFFFFLAEVVGAVGEEDATLALPLDFCGVLLFLGVLLADPLALARDRFIPELWAMT